MATLNSRVIAARNGICFSCDNPPEAYMFQKGETGLLEWQTDLNRANWYQPVVLWDRDNQKLPRRVLIIDVTNVKSIQ
jgi:hypothetical protein